MNKPSQARPFAQACFLKMHSNHCMHITQVEGDRAKVEFVSPTLAKEEKAKGSEEVSASNRKYSRLPR